MPNKKRSCDLLFGGFLMSLHPRVARSVSPSDVLRAGLAWGRTVCSVPVCWIRRQVQPLSATHPRTQTTGQNDCQHLPKQHILPFPPKNWDYLKHHVHTIYFEQMHWPLSAKHDAADQRGSGWLLCHYLTPINQEMYLLILETNRCIIMCQDQELKTPCAMITLWNWSPTPEMHFPDNSRLCAGQRSDLSTVNVVLKTRRDSTSTLGEIN